MSIDWTTFGATVGVSMVSAGGVAWAAVSGLGRHATDRWIAKYKSDLDKNLEEYRDVLERKRKQVEAELGHRTYIGKTQFDAEFNAIKETFASLGALKLSFNGMRPMLDVQPDDDSERVRNLNERLRQFVDRYNEAANRAAGYYPFCPEDIYAQVETCLKAAMTEIREIRTSSAAGRFSSGWYEDGQRNVDRFGQAYFAAATLARERFRQLKIIAE